MKTKNIGSIILKSIFLTALFGLTVLAITLFSNKDKTLITSPMFLNAGMNFVCMFGVAFLVLAGFFDSEHNSETNIYYYMILVLIFLECFFETIFYTTIGDGNVIPGYIFNTFIYLITPVLVFVFWLYQNTILNVRKVFKSTLTYIFLVLVLLDVLYVILNIPFGYIFTIDSVGKYHASELEPLTFIIPILGLLLTLFANIFTDVSIAKKWSLILFSITPIVSGLLSLLKPGYSIIYPSLFLVILLLYGVIQLKRNLDLAKFKVETSKKDQEIMISQIQPHFLYNTLSSISALCEIDPEKARDITDKFADYLRGNMNSLKVTGPVPFEHELNHVKNYVFIEKTRFSKKLKVVFDINYTDFKIPALSVQPLVENAIKHGVCCKEEGGTVTIRTTSDKKNVYIEIIDDGVGFDINSISNNTDRIHLGLENTRARLKDMVNGELTIDSIVGRGTIARITIEK